jgi:hypothetical protein
MQCDHDRHPLQLLTECCEMVLTHRNVGLVIGWRASAGEAASELRASPSDDRFLGWTCRRTFSHTRHAYTPPFPCTCSAALYPIALLLPLLPPSITLTTPPPSIASTSVFPRLHIHSPCRTHRSASHRFIHRSPGATTPSRLIIQTKSLEDMRYTTTLRTTPTTTNRRPPS